MKVESMRALSEALKQVPGEAGLDMDQAPDEMAPEAEEEETGPDPVAVVEVLKTEYPKTYAKIVASLPAAEEEAVAPEMVE